MHPPLLHRVMWHLSFGGRAFSISHLGLFREPAGVEGLPPASLNTYFPGVKGPCVGLRASPTQVELGVIQKYWGAATLLA